MTPEGGGGRGNCATHMTSRNSRAIDEVPRLVRLMIGKLLLDGLGPWRPPRHRLRVGDWGARRVGTQPVLHAEVGVIAIGISDTINYEGSMN